MKNHWVKVWNVPWTWKAIELEAYDTEKDGSEKISSWIAEVRSKREMDHAGIEIELRGIERTYGLRFYDQRHWDRENNRWKEYNNNQ